MVDWIYSGAAKLSLPHAVVDLLEQAFSILGISRYQLGLVLAIVLFSSQPDPLFANDHGYLRDGSPGAMLIQRGNPDPGEFLRKLAGGGEIVDYCHSRELLSHWEALDLLDHLWNMCRPGAEGGSSCWSQSSWDELLEEMDRQVPQEGPVWLDAHQVLLGLEAFSRDFVQKSEPCDPFISSAIVRSARESTSWLQSACGFLLGLGEVVVGGFVVGSGQYTTHNGDGTFKQYRGSGKPQGDIPRPNVKQNVLHDTPKGPRPGKSTVRPANIDEIPKA